MVNKNVKDSFLNINKLLKSHERSDTTIDGILMKF